MKNLIITIIIYRACLIRIRPLEWVLLPTWYQDSSLGERAKWVSIKKPYTDGFPTFANASYKIAYRTGMLISWLCFTLQFTRWRHVKELKSIYGADYDCAKDPAWRDKYEQLCATDYFN